MSKLNWATKSCAIFLLWATAVAALPAQTFTTLHNFDGTDGNDPGGAMVQSTDGNFYGTTRTGVARSKYGTIFSFTPSGTLTTLLNFDISVNGSLPDGALVQGPDGNFYGTTLLPEGAAFKVTSGGVLTTLYTFCQLNHCTDGQGPIAGLVLGNDGNYYGTTWLGGNSRTCTPPNGCGTVFKLTPGGVMTVLHRFSGTDGGTPTEALIQGADENFYGTTTASGGNGEGGTVFKITSLGALTTIYNFCSLSNCIDGVNPSGLVQDSSGNLYGTTNTGGTSTNCGSGGCGTVFKVTLGGTLTTLHSFGQTDGGNPYAALTPGSDGNFYGTAQVGGSGTGCGTFGCGTAFSITPGGTFTLLHNFNYTTDGSSPTGLFQSTNGFFYGTAANGGSNSCVDYGGCGTIYKLSVGLRPFVETEPASGGVGAAVNILGTNLTGATGVTFNGTAAVFTVVSPSLITTTVPAGATSGRVQVSDGSGTLSSNVIFRVLP